MTTLKVTFLGTGTSMGIPVITCDCAVCRSRDPRDRRLRSGLWLQYQGHSVLLDASVDFREQALRHAIHDVDAVLLTHTHSDHVGGLDELRIYTMRGRKAIPIFGSALELEEIHRRFAYCFHPVQIGGGVPNFELRAVDGVFDLFGQAVTPLPVKHGILDILGYRIGPLAVITDASEIPPETMARLEGVEVLILNALRPEPHATHFSLGQALDVFHQTTARQAWFVHMCHHLGHAETNADLPETAQLAYDGQVIEISLDSP